ncbi:MAG TPA: hypothetical protein PKH77_19825 [Anaerolineae bacterium]|nr:hypothetical protein [Anaerolineae bacterium]
MKLVKQIERLQPEGDLLPYTAFSIEVTPDFNLADVTIYSPANYPPAAAVLWETYDPVTWERYGQAMAVSAAANGLANLGLDPKPFLEAAARLGWLALANAVIPGELYDVTCEVTAPEALRVEVRPAHNPGVCFTGTLHPEGAPENSEPPAVTPTAADADWWVMDDAGNYHARTATCAAAGVIYDQLVRDDPKLRLMIRRLTMAEIEAGTDRINSEPPAATPTALEEATPPQPPAPAHDWWVMDGAGHRARAATIGGALAVYAYVAKNTAIQDGLLEIQHGDYHEFVRLPADFDPADLDEDAEDDEDETPIAVPDDWWVMDGEYMGRAPTIGAALALYLHAAESDLLDPSLEISGPGNYYEKVALPADFAPDAGDDE